MSGLQCQSKPSYPSYHLEPPRPLPNYPRPSDSYRPLNIIRYSPRPPQIRIPETAKEEQVLSDDTNTVRTMEEFIAVVFGNEMWMGLVDFKSDNQRQSEEATEVEIVCDGKRNSAVIVPRTFRTPMVVGQSRVKPTPIFEDTEERRVEFDVNRPTNWEEQDSSPRKRREEIRRPPPSFALLGYKYPTQSPRSILRKMDYQHGAMESTGSLKEKGYVRHARRTVDGQTAGILWATSWKEQSRKSSTTLIAPISPAKSSPRPPTPQRTNATLLPAILDSPASKKISNLSPTSTPFVPSHLRNSVPLTTILSPVPTKAKPLSAYGAERILGRMTPDSSLNTPSIDIRLHRPRPPSPQIVPRHLSLADTDIDETDLDLDDWSTRISSPSLPMRPRSMFLPAWLSGIKVSVRTDIYSPHPGGPDPETSAKAFSRVTLIDTMDSPCLEGEKIQWRVPSDGKREYDNRLYFPAGLTLVARDLSWVVDVNEEVMYLGEGRFWCGGFVVQYSSRRAVEGDFSMIKKTLREDLSWLISVEVDLRTLEGIVARSGPMIGRDEARKEMTQVGQYRDERGKEVKRELRPEMLIF